MAHDNHMLAYAAAMQGQSQKATQAITDLLADLPPDFIAAHAAKLDAFFAIIELHLRFGRWDQMLAAVPFKKRIPYHAGVLAFRSRDGPGGQKTDG